jgi:primosomal protein N' (replication factor Y)
MERYGYAEVSVNSPIAQDRTFSYRIPDNLQVCPGQAAWVPFGNKVLQGIVIELKTSPAVEEVRDIAGIIEPTPLISPVHISLACWLSRYYLSPLFASVALTLPPGFERRVITWISLSPDFQEMPATLSAEEKKVLETVRQKGQISQKNLEKIAGSRITRRVLPYLISKRLLVKSHEIEKPRVKPKLIPYLKLKVSIEETLEASSTLPAQAHKQLELLQFLVDTNSPVSMSELKEKVSFSRQALKALIEKGLVEIQERRIDRDPLPVRNINLAFPLPLTIPQKTAFQSICKSLYREYQSHGSPDVFLLHGVTGSGKTEIYIQALEEVIKLGKRGIVLVPEISMTPQVIARFVSRFPGKVAILHSQLALGEQFDEWWRIKNGEFDVVIGPRSALFAPQPDLGLIIIDEEHEWNYKQADSPRYHTREVALKLAELTGATVILGSATPDVESYYRALQGEYQLLELKERVTAGEGSVLPEVEVVDLRKELKSGNLGIFSHSLYESMEKALQNHEQILLFLNRRGAASFVECRNCGWVIRCKRCEVALSYHFTEETLICHQCNYHQRVPQFCPRCRSRRIKFLGVGTEKLEQEAAKIFPGARILRWDSDIVQKGSYSHQEIYDKLRSHAVDIVIGTQMIAKGLDLPGVTLVGVVSADVSLNLPDFRAGERTFQLLCQVAGRAGRGIKAGKVIIQTYSPEHYAIQAAAAHNYRAFYEKEIAYRYELHNPPFNRLVCLTYSHYDDARCQAAADEMKQKLTQRRDSLGLAGISLIGPAPAFIPKLRGRYRWQIIIRLPDPAAFLSGAIFPRGWSIDVDPVGLM